RTSWPSGSPVELVALDLLQGLRVLAQHGEQAHLFLRARFADLAHREADVDEHPVPGLQGLVAQQVDVDLAPHAGDIDRRELRALGRKVDDPTGDGKAHGGTSSLAIECMSRSKAC